MAGAARHRLCASGAPYCTALFPCKPCADVIWTRVLPQAMVASGLNVSEDVARAFMLSYKEAWQAVIKDAPEEAKHPLPPSPEEVESAGKAMRAMAERIATLEGELKAANEDKHQLVIMHGRERERFQSSERPQAMEIPVDVQVTLAPSIPPPLPPVEVEVEGTGASETLLGYEAAPEPSVIDTTRPPKASKKKSGQSTPSKEGNDGEKKRRRGVLRFPGDGQGSSGSTKSKKSA